MANRRLVIGAARHHDRQEAFRPPSHPRATAPFFPQANAGDQEIWDNERPAGIAQQVEQLICNQKVAGSNPAAGTINEASSDRVH
jgi:hypothetical protein